MKESSVYRITPLSNIPIKFDICGTVHHHLINKDDQRDAACSICTYYAWGITTCFGCSLHPSSGVYRNCTRRFWYNRVLGMLSEPVG